MNYFAGTVVPNGAVAELSPNGSLCIFSLAASDIVLDVTGYVPAGAAGIGTFNPERLHDTREGAGRVPAKGVIEVQVTGRAGVPEDATAAILNLVTILPDGPGYATLYPCGERPLASNVNHASAGMVVANNAVTKLSDTGTVCIFSLTETDIVLDVAGYLN